jgi:ubiquinone/menaquinone biosynthesis C-methylase UbiE
MITQVKAGPDQTTAMATALNRNQAVCNECSPAIASAAVRRLLALHDIYGPAGKRILLRAGLQPGMRVADFGCGIGTATRTLAEIVGPTGRVVGVDADASQLAQAADMGGVAGLTNISFVEADACATGLPRRSFDLVYCRFLLSHLANRSACLREMYEVLKPGGLIVVEDGDVASATSVPPSVLDAFALLFTLLGRKRGLDYSAANNLCQMVRAAGFFKAQIEMHQPAMSSGEGRFLLKWSVEEAGPALIDAGLITPDQLQSILTKMQVATEDPGVLILPPRMSIVWARKS